MNKQYNELKEKQDKEHMRIHMKCLAKSDCAKDCGESTVILMGFAVSIIEEEISKAKRETREDKREKIKQNIGLLRQYLNERTDNMGLITNKELETFLIKEL